MVAHQEGLLPQNLEVPSRQRRSAAASCRTSPLIFEFWAGSPEEFQKVQAAFEGLRKLYDRNAVTSFARDLDFTMDGSASINTPSRDVPSWDYYAVHSFPSEWAPHILRDTSFPPSL